jgi:hypothetical protein
MLRRIILALPRLCDRNLCATSNIDIRRMRTRQLISKVRFPYQFTAIVEERPYRETVCFGGTRIGLSCIQGEGRARRGSRRADKPRWAYVITVAHIPFGAPLRAAVKAVAGIVGCLLLISSGNPIGPRRLRTLTPVTKCELQRQRGVGQSKRHFQTRVKIDKVVLSITPAATSSK